MTSSPVAGVRAGPAARGRPRHAAAWATEVTTSASPTCRSTRDVPTAGRVRPAGLHAVRADPRARVRGARGRHAAVEHRDRRPSTEVPIDELLAQLPDEPIATVGRARASTSTTRRTPRSSGASSTTRSATARAPTSSSRATTTATIADWDARQGADRLPSAARARTRRVLDVPGLHRRPVPGRREPGAARQRAGRRGPDEPDQRHVPRRRIGDPASARRGCWSSSPTRRRSTSSSWSSTRS